MQARRRSVPTYADLEAKVAELERKLGQAFSVEEMDVLREQLAERAERAEAAREALEWRLRMELQRVREAEMMCKSASREMHQASNAIGGLLDDDDGDTLNGHEDDSRTLRAVPVRRRVMA
jgi:predicted nuclease with TOPRIM domain